jgi:hypothetical protein
MPDSLPPNEQPATHRTGCQQRDPVFERHRLELLLSQTGGQTELRLVHHLETTGTVGETGPGWEYYLDMLIAARTACRRRISTTTTRR